MFYWLKVFSSLRDKMEIKKWPLTQIKMDGRAAHESIRRLKVIQGHDLDS